MQAKRRRKPRRPEKIANVREVGIGIKTTRLLQNDDNRSVANCTDTESREVDNWKQTIPQPNLT
jgi:hypothetical protein